MRDEFLANHLTAENLIDYFDRVLAEEEEEALEVHLARCDDCARQARRAYVLLGQLEEWTAPSPIAAVQHEPFDGSLGEATAAVRTDTPQRQGRIEQWHVALANLGREAVRAIAADVKDASRGGLTVLSVLIAWMLRGWSSAWAGYALLLVMFVFEAALNAYFFALSSDHVLLEWQLGALGIAAVNVALSFYAGMAFRSLHNSGLYRLLATVAVVLYVGILALFHPAVGHYRTVLAQGTAEHAVLDAIVNLPHKIHWLWTICKPGCSCS